MTDSHSHGQATALGTRWPSRPAETPGYGPDPSCQPCPDCGGLECLCRPRFFAGQLLTEQDLNRLDHYMVEKSKLHNRYLVGWGVVCGLEVLCDQCEERVRVTPGYALSPCGEDIIVCKPDYVDICALIDRCRKADALDCRPYAGKDGCDEVEEEWVLAIRYMEAPARGMTALTGASSCGCGAPTASACSCGGGKSQCGCGGGGGSGCSCAGTSAAEAAAGEAPRLRRGAPPSCEPTVICEGYRYEIFRKPEDEVDDPRGDRDDDDWIVGSISGVFEKLDGEMARRMACCLREVEKAIPKPPGDLQSPIAASERQAWYRWACATKRSLAAYFARIGGTNCEAVAKLAAVPVPPPSMDVVPFQQALAIAAVQLLLIAFEAMLHCICSNLLPPCPVPEDPRVPLAVVTVRRKGCDIIKVCNWTPLRRHVTTFRSLDYWFGWLPLRRVVRDAIESVCCAVLNLPDQFEQKDPATTVDTQQPPVVEGVDMAQPQGAPVARARAAAATAPPPAPPAPPAAESDDPLDAPVTLQLGKRRGRTRVLGRAALAGLGSDGLRAADLFDLTFRRPRYPAGGFATPEDKKQAIDNLSKSGLVRTMAEVARATGVGERVMEMLGEMSSAGGGRSDGGDVAELRARLDRQDAEIAELRRGLDAAKPTRKR